jgi:hypothetical protein
MNQFLIGIHEYGTPELEGRGYWRKVEVVIAPNEREALVFYNFKHKPVYFKAEVIGEVNSLTGKISLTIEQVKALVGV